jgi:hypothetical protein
MNILTKEIVEEHLKRAESEVTLFKTILDSCDNKAFCRVFKASCDPLVERAEALCILSRWIIEHHDKPSAMKCGLLGNLYHLRPDIHKAMCLLANEFPEFVQYTLQIAERIGYTLEP